VILIKKVFVFKLSIQRAYISDLSNLQPLTNSQNIRWFVLFVGEVRLAGERVGFEVVTLDGRTCPLASSNFSRFFITLLKIQPFFVMH
jgi:hypothetical protein